MNHSAFKMWQIIVIGMLMLLPAEFAQAQEKLDENCTVSVLNRTVRVNPDGSWIIPNAPANMGPVKARATCVRDGVTKSGESEFITIPRNGVVNLPGLVLGSTTQIPVSLTITPAMPTFTATGQTVQLQVTATYPDNSTRNVTASSAGTGYTISNQAIATINANGLVTAMASGTVVIQAINDGAAGMITANVALSSADSDGDGIPDDVEIRLGLDPNNPIDAVEDFDRDGLSNKDEIAIGTDISNHDSDGDGIPDGEEVIAGADGFTTNPLLADTDGDGIRDGLEVQTGSDPTNPNSLNLARALSRIDVTPANFSLIVNTIIGQASRQLTVTGRLIDGFDIDLTSTQKGTNYNSSNLNICNFGIPDGQVFAGASGNCTITATNSGFSASAIVAVQTFAPTALSSIDIPGYANNVDVSGSYAYVAAGSTGLQVVDVSNPRTPVIVGSVDTPGNANDVRIVGNLAYVADGSAGLQIIDISNPAIPVIVGVVDTPGEANDVMISGSRAYVADGVAGLQIIDVTNPAAPQPLGSVDTPGTASGVDISGNFAVLADDAPSAVRIINVANPASPQIIGNVVIPGRAWDLRVGGTKAYVAALTGGFQVVDFSEPTNPWIESSLNSFVPVDVELSGQFALAAELLFSNAVPIVDISIPTNMIFRSILNFAPLGDSAGTGLATTHQFVYLTGIGLRGIGGLFIGQYLALEDTAGIPPTVRITAPANGSSVTEVTTLLINVEATDDVLVAAVDFWANGQVVFTDTAAPYEHTLTVPSGVSTLTLGATAIDSAGNTSTADNVTVSVIPDLPPITRITAPANGSSAIEGTTLPIKVEATDDIAVASVSFLVNDQVVFTDTVAPYEYTFTVPVGVSTLTLGATAIDSAGNTGMADNVIVNVISDPLTNATGKIVDLNGNGVSGAVVVCSGMSGTSNVDGTFTVPGLLTNAGAIKCTASLGTLSGGSAPVSPVPNGITNVGDIVVRGAIALVTDSSSNLVGLVDIETDSVVEYLIMDRLITSPNITPDKRLAVLGSQGSVLFLDLTKNPPVVDGQIRASFEVQGLQSVLGSAITPNGRYVITAGSTGGVVIDLQDRSVVAGSVLVPTSQFENPLLFDAVAITPDGASALVLSSRGVNGFQDHANVVSVYSIGSNGMLTYTGQRIKLSGITSGPRNIAITPNGKRALVTDATKSLVTVLEINNGIVANIGSISNLGTLPPTHPGTFLATKHNTSGIAITQDGKKVYVSNFQDSNLAVLRIDENDNVTDTGQRIAIPNGTPNTQIGQSGLAISPDGTRLYILGFATSKISILDIATDTLLPVTISLDGLPPGNFPLNPIGIVIK